MNYETIYTVAADATCIYLEAKGIESVVDGVCDIIGGHIGTGIGEIVIGVGLGAGAAYVMEEDGGHDRVAAGLKKVVGRVKNIVPKKPTATPV